jgi:hypothetical protein
MTTRQRHSECTRADRPHSGGGRADGSYGYGHGDRVSDLGCALGGAALPL